MNYFAYGSNLCVRRLEARGADPSKPRVAVLNDHGLRFNKVSQDGSMKANIVPAAGSGVWGVVFQISDHRLDGLRAAEGWPHHYTEEAVQVGIGGQLEEVTTYVAALGMTRECGMPYGWYLDHIRNGARAFGFPAAYLAGLDAIDSMADPNPERDHGERQYWED